MVGSSSGDSWARLGRVSVRKMMMERSRICNDDIIFLIMEL